MEEKEYKKLFWEAIEKESVAGFQNIGDMEDACKFATENGFDIKSDQQVRSLISRRDNIIWLMFVLELKNGKDIVVFHEGKPRDVGYDMVCLKTEPTKIIQIN